MSNSDKVHQIKIFLSFLVIYFVWGSTYIAIRFAIDSIPPYLMAGFRFTLSGMILYLWQIRNDPVPLRFLDVCKSVVVGLLLIVGGNGTLTWSEQYIPSGLAALILAMIPVWMVWLESIFVTRKRPPVLTIIGILLGILGVALLTGVDESVLLSKAKEGTSVFFYGFMLILAGLSWSSGSLYSRTIKSPASLLKIVSIQMLAGGLVLLVISFFKGEWQLFAPESVTTRSLLSVVYLILFGSIMTYSAYNWLLRQTSPAKVGTYAFFNPLVAVFLGWLLASEPITPKMMIGASAILSGVLLVNQSGLFRRKTKS